MRRSLRLLLVGSLALNLLVIGIIGGAALTGRGPGPLGGYSMTLGPFAQALDRADRDAIRDELRARVDLRPPSGRDRQAALRDFQTALRADPFDASAVQAIFEDQRARAGAAMVAGQEALLRRIAAMTPAARAAFADRLEKALERNRSDSPPPPDPSGG
jgi:uncharacterized membrane protein